MTHDRDWVEDLCPADLWHYHAMEARVRNERLREQLHLMVSAAAVTADGGKAFEAMDRTLAPKGGPGRTDGEGATAKPAPLTDEQLAYATKAAADAERMWG